MLGTLLFGLLAIWRAAAAQAEEATATVVVTGERIPEAVQRAPTSFVSVIDPASHANRVETVADVLADTVGVHVRRSGGLGAFSTVSLRGSAADQVQIYLDGVPLSRAHNETVNLDDLPLDSLQRIEVYRGTTPIMFGTGGVAGVINLVTKPASESPASQVAVSYGSFDTRKVVATHTRAVGPVDVLGHLTYLGSAGDFTFRDDNGTPFNATDDETVRRENNAFESGDALFKAGYHLFPDVRLDWTSDTFVKHQGVPGIGSHQSRTASLADLRAVNQLQLTSTGIADGAADARGALYGVYEQVAFKDPLGELGFGEQDRRDRTSVLGGNIRGSYWGPSIAGTIHTATWLSELSSERFAPYNREQNPANQPDQTRLHLALAAQDEIAAFADHLLAVTSLRYEQLADSGTAFTRTGEAFGPRRTQQHHLWDPAIGVQVRPQPWLIVKGNLGRFERAPNFGELFGITGAVVGNPTLQPESGINRDVGVEVHYRLAEWRGIDLGAEYAYFNNDVDDLIVLVEIGQGIFRPLNTAARVRGHEARVQLGLADHLRLDANATLQDAENRSDAAIYRGRQLPGRPADEYYLRLEGFGAWGKLYYECNLISGNYLDQANFDRVPSRDIHTVGIEVRPPGPLTFGFEARNITDNQISDIAGFPLPGRAFFGTLGAKF